MTRRALRTGLTGYSINPTKVDGVTVGRRCCGKSVIYTKQFAVPFAGLGYQVKYVSGRGK